MIGRSNVLAKGPKNEFPFEHQFMGYCKLLS